MIRVIIFCVIAFVFDNISGQSRIISGEIIDTSGTPMTGVEICADQLKRYDNNCSYSNIDGLWAIKIDPEENPYLHFYHPGYLSLSIKVDSVNPMKIVMEEAQTFHEGGRDYPQPYQPKTRGHGSLQFGIDFNRGNYDDFRILLGNINTGFLNNTKPILFAGFGYEWSHLTLGLNVGYTPSYGDKDLVEKAASDNFFFDLNMGRKIVDSRKWKLKPNIGFKFYNYNMTSTTLEDDASLAEYLDNREIELNFSQPFGYVGLDLEYKFQTSEEIYLNYWSIGCYGNFQFKLTDTPLLETRMTRLDSDIPIDFWRINWGVSGRMYFGSRM